MNGLLKFVGLIVLGSVSAVAQEAPDYAIKLQQPLKSGQRYKLTATGRDTSTNSMTVADEVVKKESENSTYEFESIVTVIEVDAGGRPTKESHSVTKFFKSKGGTNQSLFSKG